MARIAAELMCNAKCTDSDLAFSVFHVSEMLANLDKRYQAAYNGDDDALAYRLINHPAKSSREIKEELDSLPPEDDAS